MMISKLFILMFSARNVEGFNDPVHIYEARRLVSQHKLCLIGLLDIRVRRCAEQSVKRLFCLFVFMLLLMRIILLVGLRSVGTPLRLILLFFMFAWGACVMAKFLTSNLTCQITFVYAFY